MFSSIYISLDIYLFSLCLWHVGSFIFVVACQEGPLEEEMATHSSIFTWKIPQTEEPGRLQSMRLKLSQLHITHSWTSLGVQWLKHHTPNAGGMDSIPDQRTKIPHGAAKNNNNNSFLLLRSQAYRWVRTLSI